MSLKGLKSKSDEALASISRTPVPDAAPVRPMTAPGATALMQPTIDALNERTKEAEAEASKLRRQIEKQPTEMPLEMLVEKASRRRRLAPEQFEELKANLSSNPLVHPIAVRRLEDGRFEIVSGHNRADAFRALGRPSVPVVVTDIAESIADRSAFYANLLQPALPDYEKYLGFKRERDETQKTQKQLAKEAGVAEVVVSMLFAFEQLPSMARELLERRPSAMGMHCASELAKLAQQGKEERVIEAIDQLVAGKITQKEAVGFAAKPVVSPRTREEAKPVKVKVGRLEFCQYLGRGTTLRIDFKSYEHRAEAETAIAKLLNDLAQETRKKND